MIGLRIGKLVAGVALGALVVASGLSPASAQEKLNVWWVKGF